MLLTTTALVEGHSVDDYLGLVVGEAIMGANVIKDFFAGIRDIVGGRSASYENELSKAREMALADLRNQAASLGANAIIGIDFDYEVVGQSGSMLMVSISGTAVRLSRK